MKYALNSIFFISFITLTICFTSCEDDQIQSSKPKVIEAIKEEDGIEVENDPTFKADVAGRIDYNTGFVANLRRIHVFLARGASATGTVRLQLVRTDTRVVVARTGNILVSPLSTVDDCLSETTPIFWKVETILPAGISYRMEVICTDKMTAGDPSKAIFWAYSHDDNSSHIPYAYGFATYTDQNGIHAAADTDMKFRALIDEPNGTVGSQTQMTQDCWLAINDIGTTAVGQEFLLPLTFDDTRFESEIYSNARPSISGPLTIASLENITYFSTNSSNINLAGIEHLKNLQGLSIGVHCDNLQLVGELPSLKTLRILDSELEDISFISKLGSLEVLDLDVRKLSDISPLTSMGITYLRLNNTSGNSEFKLSDPNVISTLANLRSLVINNYLIDDVTPLAALNNLTDLNLNFNKIHDVSPLKGLSKLIVLNIQSNEVGDISTLGNLKDLVIFNLEHNSINDISPLRDLTKLQHLNLKNNMINDVTSLRGLTNLTSLLLTGNPLSLGQVADLHQYLPVTDIRF